MSIVIQCELILPITAKFIRVCTMYVQCIPRQLAWFHHGSWRVVCTEMNTIFGATFVGHWFEDALSANCSRENVGGEMFAGKRSVRVAHTAKVERFVFATNGAIERFGNLVRHELMNVWRDSILFASLTRHTIVANATIKTVPCHGKSGCLRLRSN